jgi:hypothetical protein
MMPFHRCIEIDSNKVDGELLGMEDLQPVLLPRNQVAYIVTS